MPTSDKAQIPKTYAQLNKAKRMDNLQCSAARWERESSLLASKSGVQFETRDPATNNMMNSEDSHHIQLLYMHHDMYIPELLHTNTQKDIKVSILFS